MGTRARRSASATSGFASFPDRLTAKRTRCAASLSTEGSVERRDFLAAAAVTAAAPIPTLGALAEPQGAARQFIELRRYHLLPGAKQRAFTSFVGDTMIP